MNGNWVRGIHQLTGLRRVVYKTFDAQAISTSDIRLIVGAVDLLTSKLIYFDSRYKPGGKQDPDYERRALDSADRVIASCSIPAFFPPVRIGGEELVDGGVRDIAPLSVAIHTLKDMAKDDNDEHPLFELYVMLCDPLGAPRVDERRNLLSVLLRTIDVMCNEIMRDDLETVKKINADLRMPGGSPSRFRHVEAYLIYPDHEVIGVLEVDHDKIEAGIAHGRARAELAMQTPRATLASKGSLP
jgi:predicted acylesterase/phospholipase RssA